MTKSAQAIAALLEVANEWRESDSVRDDIKLSLSTSVNHKRTIGNLALWRATDYLDSEEKRIDLAVAYLEHPRDAVFNKFDEAAVPLIWRSIFFHSLALGEAIAVHVITESYNELLAELKATGEIDEII